MRLRKSGIVEVFVLGNLGFKRDVFPDIETVLIQHQGREKAAHPAIAIVERMNTEKIMDEHRNCDQWFYFKVPDHTVIFFADSVKSRWRFIGSQRGKKNFAMAIGISCADIILHILCSSCDGVVHMTVQDLMQLQNIILRNRNHIKIFVNEVQDITVSCNLLFIPVARCGFFFHELLDSSAGGHDSLDGIGGLGALHLCNLDQMFQFFRTLLQIKFLLTRFFIDCSNIAENLGIPFLLFDFGVIECSHALTALSFP